MMVMILLEREKIVLASQYDALIRLMEGDLTTKKAGTTPHLDASIIPCYLEKMIGDIVPMKMMLLEILLCYCTGYWEAR